MSKAILVLDMPEKCEDCQLAEKQSGEYWYCNALHNYTSFIDFNEKKPSNCPLRPMPEKKQLNGDVHNMQSLVEEISSASWNACIDAITGDVN